MCWIKNTNNFIIEQLGVSSDLTKPKAIELFTNQNPASSLLGNPLLTLFTIWLTSHAGRQHVDGNNYGQAWFGIARWLYQFRGIIKISVFSREKILIRINIENVQILSNLSYSRSIPSHGGIVTQRTPTNLNPIAWIRPVTYSNGCICHTVCQSPSALRIFHSSPQRYTGRSGLSGRPCGRRRRRHRSSRARPRAFLKAIHFAVYNRRQSVSQRVSKDIQRLRARARARPASFSRTKRRRLTRQTISRNQLKSLTQVATTATTTATNRDDQQPAPMMTMTTCDRSN